MLVMSPTASTAMALKLSICLLAPSTNKRDANNTNNKVSAISWASWVVAALSHLLSDETLASVKVM